MSFLPPPTTLPYNSQVAVSLMKVANDIRFLGSGPRCGLGELQASFGASCAVTLCHRAPQGFQPQLNARAAWLPCILSPTCFASQLAPHPCVLTTLPALLPTRQLRPILTS